MNLPDGTHLAWFDYRRAWYASRVREAAISISASDDDDGGGAWSFSVAEADLGEHGTAIQVRVFEDAFEAFTQIPEFFTSLASMEIRNLDEVTRLLAGIGAADETATEPPYAAEADPVEKAAAIIRNHPAGTRDQKASRKLATAILREITEQETRS